MFKGDWQILENQRKDHVTNMSPEESKEEL